MKKIIPFAIAVALATSASFAATLNWAVTATNADKNGNVLSGTTVALLKATGNASDIAYTVEGGVTGAEVIDVSTLSSGKFSAPKGIAVGEGGWGSGKYSGTGLDGNATSVTSQGTGTGNKTTYYMLVFDSSPTGEGNYTILSAAGPTTVASSTVAVAATAFSAASGSNSTWVSYGAIPEPCSIALIALGLAVFGLKRKVA